MPPPVVPAKAGTPPGVGAVREPPPRAPLRRSCGIRHTGWGALSLPHGESDIRLLPQLPPSRYAGHGAGCPARNSLPCRANSTRHDREKQQNATLFRKHPRLPTPVALFFRSEPAVASCRISVALTLHFVRVGVAFRLDRCCIRPHPTSPSIPLRPGATATIPPSAPQ